MWVALLNLENMYGSQESLTKVFERAVQYNEPLKVFLQLADIYTKSEKFQVGVWAWRPAEPVPWGSRRQQGRTPMFWDPVLVLGSLGAKGLGGGSPCQASSSLGACALPSVARVGPA